MTQSNNQPAYRKSRTSRDPLFWEKLVLSLLILAVGVGAVLYYIVGPAEYYMTGDSTDSLRWAQASFESGKLISPDFSYAAILPFGGNLIFYPFIALFGYSVAAQVAGLVLFTLLFVFALWYMATGIGLKNLSAAGLVTVTLLIMSSSAKLREIMWEHVFYYNLGILFFCLGVGLVSRILRDKSAVMSERSSSKLTLSVWIAFIAATVAAFILSSYALNSVISFFIAMAIFAVLIVILLIIAAAAKLGVSRLADWTRLVVLAVFSLLAATNGLQTLVCFTLPIIAGIFAERLFDGETPVLSKKNLCALGVLATIGVATIVGIKLTERATGGVTAGYQEAYSAWSAMSSWSNNFLGFFSNWFSLLGVSATAGDPLMSSESVINILRIFGGLVLLAAPIVLLFFWKKLTSRGVRIALIGHFSVSAFILFAVTFGKLGGANWRLTPMLGTSCILSFVAAVELIRQKKVAARVGALLLAVLILLSLPSAVTIGSMEKDNGDNLAWHMAADALVERGLRYGYANFWFAETITMLSDGQLEVANIREGTSSPQKYDYQLPSGSFDDREDDEAGYFLLLTEAENKSMKTWLLVQNIEDDFEIQTVEYNLRGHRGNVFYVYVFAENIFE